MLMIATASVVADRSGNRWGSNFEFQLHLKRVKFEFQWHLKEDYFLISVAPQKVEVSFQWYEVHHSNLQTSRCEWVCFGSLRENPKKTRYSRSKGHSTKRFQRKDPETNYNYCWGESQRKCLWLQLRGLPTLPHYSIMHRSFPADATCKGLIVTHQISSKKDFLNCSDDVRPI